MKTNHVNLNRPWISSFNFGSAAYSDAGLKQIHKLSRNFIASLDLGCPSVRHVTDQHNGSSADETPRELYRRWVADWKVIYRELTQLIRTVKSHRRTARFPELTAAQLSVFRLAHRQSNRPHQHILADTAHQHLPRLRETAQALLNARYNARLAAAEAWRRERAAAAAKPVEEERLAA